jgi:hypothetical protein
MPRPVDDEIGRWQRHCVHAADGGGRHAHQVRLCLAVGVDVHIQRVEAVAELDEPPVVELVGGEVDVRLASPARELIAGTPKSSACHFRPSAEGVRFHVPLLTCRPANRSDRRWFAGQAAVVRPFPSTLRSRAPRLYVRSCVKTLAHREPGT